ncbi:MAG: polysaccharide deacetylase family sporulation protein PdaB [Acidobacteriota bacterium]
MIKPSVIGFYFFSTRTKIAILTLAVIIFIVSSMIYVEAYNKLKPIYDLPAKDKVVALTFDISWGNQTPMPVIEILKQNNVRSTFFLSGPWCKQYPDIPKRIKQDGHEIASHGYRHINLSTLSRMEIKEEIMKAHDSIKEVTGIDPILIRTPNGDYSDEVIKAADECRYKVIQWSVDSLDWMNPGVGTISERVIKRVQPGSIILMHASDTCKQTTEALPTILKELKNQGYEFVTVSELMKRAEKK